VSNALIIARPAPTTTAEGARQGDPRMIALPESVDGMMHKPGGTGGNDPEPRLVLRSLPNLTATAKSFGTIPLKRGETSWSGSAPGRFAGEMSQLGVPRRKGHRRSLYGQLLGQLGFELAIFPTQPAVNRTVSKRHTTTQKLSRWPNWLFSSSTTSAAAPIVRPLLSTVLLGRPHSCTSPTASAPCRFNFSPPPARGPANSHLMGRPGRPGHG